VKRSAFDSRARLKRTALSALRRARRAAERAGISLSEWEGDFLQSVESRVAAFGSAFADPQKGPAGAALSNLQGAKLEEINRKARGKPPPKGRAWRRTRSKTEPPGRNPQR
jgi:hypothetical protein